MNKKILIGVIIAVAIIILPSSMVKGKDEIKTEKHISENLLYIKPIPDIALIIGRISNLTIGGGYSPHYFFYIEKCLTLNTKKPFFEISKDCNAQILIPSYTGFINNYFIFGITQTLYISH